MPAKPIGRPPTGATKTKKSVTIDTDILAAAESAAADKKTSLSSLVEAALESYLQAAGTPSRIGHASPAANVVSIRPGSKTAARPHLVAAAGSPLNGEVMDWDGREDTVLVKISGLSMTPLLNDGDVIPMKHKRASRNPFMKKGLIYLVEYDDGYTVKRYNTRPARPAEKHEDWVDNGKVKVLQSLNSDFSEIIIKQEVEWIAWYDK